MFKLYLTSILVAEVVAVAAVEVMSPGGLVLYLVPIIPLTLVVAFIVRRRFGGSTYGVHRLSPQAIAGYRARDPATNSPEELSRAIDGVPELGRLQLMEVRGCLRHRETEARGEVLLVADHHVDQPGEAAVDLLRSGLAAD